MPHNIGNLLLRDLLIPIVRASDSIARLDDRVARSAVRDGWIERSHFADTAASLYIDGELVHVEDLVLHDAHMDVRAPTHALVIAHTILRVRRQISASDPDWALGDGGLAILRAGDGALSVAPERKDLSGMRAVGIVPDEAIDDGVNAGDAFGAELAAIDAVLARSRAVLDGAASSPRRVQRDPTIYDDDWDEDARLAEWRTVAVETEGLPPVLRAALLLDAWQALDVLQHSPWLGRLLVAATLRQTATTVSHLLAINTGLRDIRWERRRASDKRTRLAAFLDAVDQAGRNGLKEHDRLLAVRHQLERKLTGRRSNSKLPQLMELVLSKPLVSTAMIVRQLKITPQGAVGLAEALALREMTGRGRYRAWGVV